MSVVVAVRVVMMGCGERRGGGKDVQSGTAIEDWYGGLAAEAAGVEGGLPIGTSAIVAICRCW